MSKFIDFLRGYYNISDIDEDKKLEYLFKNGIYYPAKYLENYIPKNYIDFVIINRELYKVIGSYKGLRKFLDIMTYSITPDVYMYFNINNNKFFPPGQWLTVNFIAVAFPIFSTTTYWKKHMKVSSSIMNIAVINYYFENPIFAEVNHEKNLYLPRLGRFYGATTDVEINEHVSEKKYNYTTLEGKYFMYFKRRKILNNV